MKTLEVSAGESASGSTMDQGLAFEAIAYAYDMEEGTSELVSATNGSENVEVLIEVDFDGSISVSTPEWT